MNAGFTTLHEEHMYHKCIYAMLTVLQSRLLALVAEDPEMKQAVFCEKFVEHFRKIFYKMQSLDMVKQTDPKFSPALKSLAETMGLNASTH